MFTERLRWLRECKEVTQTHMAKVLNLASTSYHDYESGKSKPPMDTLIKLAAYFNVSVDYLLGLTDIAEPHYVKLSPMQSDFINQFDTFTPEELEILEIYNNLSQDLKVALCTYFDFFLLLEVKSRMKTVTTLNVSKSNNTPHQESQRQTAFDEHTLYTQLKNEIKNKIKEKTSSQQK